MSSENLAYFVPASIAWAACAYTARDLWRGPRTRLRGIVFATLLIVAIQHTLAAPHVIGLVNRWTGITNLAVPLLCCLAITLGVCARLLVVSWKGPEDQVRRQARWWLLGCALADLAVVLLFIAGHAPVERPVDFDVYYASALYIREMLLIFLLAQVATLGNIGWVCWQWAKVAGRLWLRRGLRLILIGATLAVAFDLTRLLAMVARWFGGDLDFLSTSVAPALGALSAIVGTLGFILPMSEERLTRAASWINAGRRHRSLRPLWSALWEAVPTIDAGVQLPWWDLHLRLTRRLAEIADGCLALRPYADPEVADLARRLTRHDSGMTDRDREAVVEAACLRAAITARQRGIQFPPAEGSRGSNLASPLAHYVMVSRAFQRSPIVATVARTATATLRAQTKERTGTQ